MAVQSEKQSSGVGEVRVSATSSAVYDVVRSRIISGQYAPGAHLTETELSDELGVSRTPIRAALRRLSDDGLITTEPNRGAFVTQWTPSDVNEVFDLRCLLESQGAALAADRRSEDESLHLSALVDDMARIAERKTSTYRDDLHHNNQQFHLAVLRAAHSPRLFTITEQLTNTSVTLGTYFYYTDNDIARSVHFHRDIATAIAMQNRSVASALMGAHIGVAHAAFAAARFADTQDKTA